MGEDSKKRVALLLALELLEQLVKKRILLGQTKGQLIFVEEELSILSASTYDEALEIRRLGLSNDALGIVDEKIREKYRELVYVPREQRKVELKSQLEKLQDEILIFEQEALPRAIDAAGSLRFAIARLGSLGYSRQRVIDEWNEIQSGKELGKVDSVVERIFRFFIEKGVNVDEEKIGCEYDELKTDGYFV